MNTSRLPDRTAALRPQERLAGLQKNLTDTMGLHIVAGDWEIGSVIPQEIDLLEQFGISRPTLREALRVLASKGLIASKQRVGTTVQPLNRWNLLDPDVLRWLASTELNLDIAHELLVFRRMIEPQVARLAAMDPTAEAISTLRNAFLKMQAAQADKIAYYHADRVFHDALFAATSNRFIGSLGQTVLAVLDLSFSLQSKSVIDPMIGLRMHENVLRAVESRSADDAELAMLALLKKAEDEMNAARRNNQSVPN